MQKETNVLFPVYKPRRQSYSDESKNDKEPWHGTMLAYTTHLYGLYPTALQSLLSQFSASVHTRLDRSWIDLSSHLSVHIQIALDLDRSQIDLTHTVFVEYN